MLRIHATLYQHRATFWPDVFCTDTSGVVYHYQRIAGKKYAHFLVPLEQTVTTTYWCEQRSVITGQWASVSRSGAEQRAFDTSSDETASSQLVIDSPSIRVIMAHGPIQCKKGYFIRVIMLTMALSNASGDAYNPPTKSFDTKSTRWNKSNSQCFITPQTLHKKGQISLQNQCVDVKTRDNNASFEPRFMDTKAVVLIPECRHNWQKRCHCFHCKTKHH